MSPDLGGPHAALVALDAGTGRPTHQFRIPGQVNDYLVHLPRQDHYFFGGPEQVERIDLRTGQHEVFEPYPSDLVDLSRRFVALTDEFLVELRGDRLLVVALDTADLAASHEVGPFAAGRELGGVVWVTGDRLDDPERFYRIDLTTGELSDPVDGDELARFDVEIGEHSWGAFAADDDGQIQWWQQVELASGQVVGEWDFGDYRPWLEAAGHLWLRSDEGLGRVPLGELD